MILIFYAILSGLLAILSSSILPLLFVAVALGVGGSRLKPVVLLAAFILSFGLFGPSLLSNGSLFGIDRSIIQLLMGDVLVLIGLLRVIRQVTHNREQAICRMGQTSAKGHTPGAHALRGLVAGVALGLTWTPSTGPILASLLTLAASGKFLIAVSILFIAYALGVSLVLCALTYLTTAIVIQLTRVQIAAQSAMFFLTLLAIGAGLLFVSGTDVFFETALRSFFPFDFLAL